MLSAVHATEPISRAASIPVVPLSPIDAMTTDARISVMSVMPETGFVPTIAVALAATVVKRNAMPTMSTRATVANIQLWPITPRYRKAPMAATVTMTPAMTTRNDTSRCVRGVSPASAPFPLSSREARLTALVIMPHDFIMPIMPAMAMPPMPIDFP